MIPGREAAPERQHSGDARVGGRGRARTTGTPNGGSRGGRVAAATCTGGVGFASLSAPCQAIVQLRRPTAPEKSLTAHALGILGAWPDCHCQDPKGVDTPVGEGLGALTSDKVTASVSHVRHIHDEARAETGAQVIPLRPASAVSGASLELSAPLVEAFGPEKIDPALTEYITITSFGMVLGGTLVHSAGGALLGGAMAFGWARWRRR